MHEVAEVQDTAASKLLWVLGGAGADWMVHVDPFQPSASGVGLPFEPGLWPAASHEVGVVQETELRLLLTDPGVAGGVFALARRTDRNLAGRRDPGVAAQTPVSQPPRAQLSA